jgi:hypothetical protein
VPTRGHRHLLTSVGRAAMRRPDPRAGRVPASWAYYSDGRAVSTVGDVTVYVALLIVLIVVLAYLDRA